MHAMHAHRLWTKLWITLGHPEENYTCPEGNAVVKRRRASAAHSLAGRCARFSHSPCAQPPAALAGPIAVIPGIHRPYDDYQFCNARQIPIKVGKRAPTAGPVRNTPAVSPGRPFGPECHDETRPDKEGDR